ncbi:hypothetical protein Q4F19_13965 [Sphingomonas sp. BIUV-7]|uniref:DUF304 domain-containing protein n=2 Tax=Sphingomonas natans TaxID=3063330 RepID=A0ABT8YAZ4_9SPHN|nr:hypothetical protein [Sphingomonas sp. BIUV-7]
MIWALVGLSVVEMGVVHALIALWKPAVGLCLSAVTLLGIAWLVRLVRSFPRLPVLVGEDIVVMRVGTLRRIDVPADAIARLRASWTAEALKQRSVLRLSLLAYPNVVIDLTQPLPHGKRAIRAVAHRLDDPAAFSAALAELQGADDRR